MNTEDLKDLEMGPEEKIKAIMQLAENLENDFVQLGQLLSEVKRTKLFKFRGYPTFKEFVEAEFNLSSSFANKLVSNYDVFVAELDVDELAMKQIGLDKLNMIKPMVKDVPFQESEEWIKKAEQLSTTELREEIKEIKELKKDQNLNPKDVLVDQFFETMVTFFNCSKKELNFKLALYFQDNDLEAIREDIKIKQRRYDAENSAE